MLNGLNIAKQDILFDIAKTADAEIIASLPADPLQSFRSRTYCKVITISWFTVS